MEQETTPDETYTEHEQAEAYDTPHKILRHFF